MISTEQNDTQNTTTVLPLTSCNLYIAAGKHRQLENVVNPIRYGV